MGLRRTGVGRQGHKVGGDPFKPELAREFNVSDRGSGMKLFASIKVSKPLRMSQKWIHAVDLRPRIDGCGLWLSKSGWNCQMDFRAYPLC
jgi:hypothetical protein